MRWAGTRGGNGQQLPATGLLPHTALVINLASKDRYRCMSFPLRLNKSNEEMHGGVGFQHLISPVAGLIGKAGDHSNLSFCCIAGLHE